LSNAVNRQTDKLDGHRWKRTLFGRGN